MNLLEDLKLHSSFEDNPFEKMSAIAEKFFGTKIDPDQIPVTKTSRLKLKELSPFGLNCALDENRDPISWVVCIPTTLNLMNEFISGKITEKEMFDRTEKSENYSALYLCSAITIPQYRRKGIARFLILESVNKFKELNPDIQLFAWIYSKEGSELSKSLPFDIKFKK